MRIGLDIDGVMYQWDKTARYMLRTMRGCDELTDESASWYHIRDNVSSADWKWLWSEGVQLGLFRHGHLYKGTIEAVRELATIGDLVIITSRPKAAIQDTLEWLSYHRFPVSEVHILGDALKSSVIPHCDLYVDDSLENCRDLSSNTLAGVLLWTRPWNEDLVAPWGVYRVRTWQEVIDAARTV